MGTKVPDHWPSKIVKPDCAHLSLDNNQLVLSLGALPIPTSREEAVHCCVCRANQPCPSDVLAYYFEVTIMQRGDRADITVGLLPPRAKPGIQPGLVADSFGLNGAEGTLYKGPGPGDPLTHAFRVGDVLGAGIIPGKSCVFFTRNGKMLACPAGDRPKCDLYPAISLRGRHPAVAVNFGQKDFAFSLEELLQQERAVVCSQIRQERIDRAHLHTVVRDYLVAHAYEDTLSHFDQAYNQRALPCLSREQKREPTHSARLRKQVHAAIVGKQADLAMQLVERHFPEVLTTSDSSAPLYLCCQSFIDKLMVGKVEEALQFAQQRLKPFKQCCSPQHQQLLRETLALLAYADPADSPMSYLVLDEHRRKAARVVNTAILFHLVNAHSDGDTGMENGRDEADGSTAARDEQYLWRQWPLSVLGAPSFLERMMQQLCTVQGDLGGAGGMPRGDFTLQDVQDLISEGGE